MPSEAQISSEHSDLTSDTHSAYNYEKQEQKGLASVIRRPQNPATWLRPQTKLMDTATLPRGTRSRRCSAGIHLLANHCDTSSSLQAKVGGIWRDLCCRDSRARMPIEELLLQSEASL
ncbi:BQ5605_C009g05466 [Microbotryum silenes-dioicae]|uniref:BQ5605_C009g05466 protein n=1 Tax=Microbotryum silenes-dioicae TaxID=796604 RepID=A0A2X0N068_9BASI|nr:BQ5605_C009g05466 [Microbotryum silenes-dioicae]